VVAQDAEKLKTPYMRMLSKQQELFQEFILEVFEGCVENVEVVQTLATFVLNASNISGNVYQLHCREETPDASSKERPLTTSQTALDLARRDLHGK
jgi:hypothetical protein